MGLCASGGQLSKEEQAELKAAKKRSKELDRQQQEDLHRDSLINKLLLLGAGESGKSTLFKQMITIYGPGFTDQERKDFVRVIHNNAIGAIKTLVTQSKRFADELGEEKAKVDDSLEPSMEFILSLNMSDAIDAAAAEHIGSVWKDAGIQYVYSQRSHYQLTDSAGYFFDRLDQISDANYIPTQQDVLRSRVRTTGIVENEFVIDGNKFQMFDVGGQRNERKKWIHCFSDVTAVLFVAAMSAYDMVLFEDESTNRMIEALNLFEEICNSRWFNNTSIILFLNKRDLFAEKICEVPLKVCPAFADYSGGNTYEETSEYILAKFKDRQGKRAQEGKHVLYHHFTCATDTENVRVVFNAVKDIIIRKSLEEGGLLS